MKEIDQYLPLLQLNSPLQSVVQMYQTLSGHNLHSSFAKNSILRYKIDKVSLAFEETLKYYKITKHSASIQLNLKMI